MRKYLLAQTAEQLNSQLFEIKCILPLVSEIHTLPLHAPLTDARDKKDMCDREIYAYSAVSDSLGMSKFNLKY